MARCIILGSVAICVRNSRKLHSGCDSSSYSSLYFDVNRINVEFVFCLPRTGFEFWFHLGVFFPENSQPETVPAGMREKPNLVVLNLVDCSKRDSAEKYSH